MLFLVTLAICLPTLYLFNLVFGARLSVLQACALIMVAITVTAVLTFAFAPISLFFLITARSYAFFKLLNVAILILTALIGLRFLTSGMRALNEHVVVSRRSPTRSSCRRRCPSGNWSRRPSAALPNPRPTRPPTATRRPPRKNRTQTRTACRYPHQATPKRWHPNPPLASGRRA